MTMERLISAGQDAGLSLRTIALQKQAAADARELARLVDDVRNGWGNERPY
jgi:hypothetical protein